MIKQKVSAVIYNSDGYGNVEIVNVVRDIDRKMLDELYPTKTRSYNAGTLHMPVMRSVDTNHKDIYPTWEQLQKENGDLF